MSGTLPERSKMVAMATDAKKDLTKVEEELCNERDVDQVEDLCCIMMDISTTITRLEDALNYFHTRLQREAL